MLYYQFAVISSSAAQPDEFDNEAKIMVRVDRDIEESTDYAVRFLESRGWRVTSVRHAQSAETLDEFEKDDDLANMYRQAARTGMAYTIVPARVTASVR